MNPSLRFLIGICLAIGTLLWGQTQKNERSSNVTSGPVDVLTDIKGINFGEYLPKIIHRIQTKWYDRIPLVAQQPFRRRGMVTIDFQVLKNGEVQKVKYLDRSGDSSLDQAAFSSVEAASPLPALPGQVTCQYVELRFHFYYNPEPGDLKPDSRHDLLPCVTTTIYIGEETEFRVSPSLSQVSVGGREQFLASNNGDANPSVTWTISGTSCSNARCGTISSSGLYSAPEAVPDVPTITITAVLSSDPQRTASAKLTIVKARSFP